MADLWKRIQRRYAMTVSDFRNDSRFSYQLAVCRMGSELCGRFGPKSVAAVFGKKKDAWITDFLTKELGFVIDRFASDTDAGQPQENAPIWVCWWTGEETAPPLVRQCIKSIRANAGSHPVYLIDRDNYEQFLEIPDFILSKVASGKMCIANFSDYLRFSLLAQYGGLWLDATVFCADIIKECWQVPLFSCKGKTGEGMYVSDYRWTGFCIGGNRGHILFRFMCAAFEEYWKRNETAVDYLLVDYIINLGYSTVGAIKTDIDAISKNNLRRDDLQAAMNCALSAEKWQEIVRRDTIFYKLSWREKYSETTQDGKESVYGYFLNRHIT